MEEYDTIASIVSSVLTILSVVGSAQKQGLKITQSISITPRVFKFIALSLAWLSLALVYNLVMQPYGLSMNSREEKQFTGILLAGPAILIAIYALTLNSQETNDNE